MQNLKKGFLFLLLFCLQGTLLAKTYHVNDIDSLLNKIEVLSSGDTINLAENEYILPEGKRIVLRDKHNITIKGVPYKSIIDGRNVVNDVIEKNGKPTTWAGLFEITDSTNITISGLYLRYSKFAGFFVSENSQSIIIENSYTEDTYSSGIGVWDSKYIYIYGNEIEKACNNGGQESITIANSSNVEVVGNDVHHNGVTIMDNNDTGGEGIDIKGGSYNVLVKQNRVHDLSGRTGIYIDAWNKKTHTIEISDNDVFNIGHTGISVASECGGELKYIDIHSNRVINSAWAGIEIAGYSNSKAVCGDDMSPIENVKKMSEIYIFANYIEGNGKGICSKSDPTPCRDEYTTTGDGGIAVRNPNASEVYIGNNTLKNNKTDYDSALTYDIYTKENSQLLFWDAINEVEIEANEPNFYIFDNIQIE